MQYLDALEGLRTQVTVRRYEIMQKFIEGVRNYELKRNLPLMYAQEQYVEALRFTVQQYLRMRGASRSDNYPAQPQHQQPIQPVNHTQQAPAAPLLAPNAQQPQQPAAYRPQQHMACFNCGDPSHFVIDCPLKDRARKPVQQQLNSCHNNPSGAWSCPSNPHGIIYDTNPASLPLQGTVAFCVYCGRTGHVASECIMPDTIRQEEQVKTTWYAPVSSQMESVDSGDQIRVIPVAEAGGPSRPVSVTCGKKQVLTTFEASAPDCTETLISIHLMLSAEQQHCPDLTLAQLKEALCRNTKYKSASRPLFHFLREVEKKLVTVQKFETVFPVPVAINVDGVDVKFDAIVVLEGLFPQGLYLGRQELKCYIIGVQDATGEARIDERALLAITFKSQSLSSE